MAVFLIGPTSVKYPTGFHGIYDAVSGQECECHRQGNEAFPPAYLAITCSRWQQTLKSNVKAAATDKRIQRIGW
jgi:hypothetical protein